MEYAKQVHSATFEVKALFPHHKNKHTNSYFPLYQNLNLTIITDSSSACLSALQKIIANLDAIAQEILTTSCFVLPLNKIFHLEIAKFIQTRFSFKYALIYMTLKF